MGGPEDSQAGEELNTLWPVSEVKSIMVNMLNHEKRKSGGASNVLSGHKISLLIKNTNLSQK